MPAGYTPEEIVYWWVAIGVGFVVVLVVILLLSVLISLVKIIDRGVVNVRDTLRAITGNTQHTTLIPETAEGVDAVLAEGLQHHLFLTRALTGAGLPPIGKVQQ
ncbi:MAG: hypothetical protein ACRDTE_28560 [Pseudonocardiaceae bacterium]